MTSSEQWRYVATEDNPADFVSRGMDSLKLKTCELWWNSPKFLMSNQYPQRQIPVAVIKDPGRSITSIVEPDLTNLNENRNVKPIEIQLQLVESCGENVMSDGMGRKWVQQFSDEDTNVHDEATIERSLLSIMLRGFLTCMVRKYKDSTSQMSPLGQHFDNILK
ncbi:hypothetical protein TNCV_4409581 [Trichonephila clavipes]|nr:hypothetical protein TNCV_4409581 [Trichonephila clavipes]